MTILVTICFIYYIIHCPLRFVILYKSVYISQHQIPLTKRNTNMNNKYVIFYRVSTKQQGESGLGLEAQKRDIDIYLSTYTETPFTIVNEYTSVHSGGSIEKCEQFQKAIQDCKTHNAILLVAKVDRIARKVSTIATVLETVKVKIAVMPFADNFQIHIYAALAEQEREFISVRTKAALKEAKARGVRLGGNRIGSEKANKAKSSIADNRAEKYRTILEHLLQTCTTYAEIAKQLTIINTEGKHFQTIQVQRMMKRLEIGLAPLGIGL